MGPLVHYKLQRENKPPDQRLHPFFTIFPSKLLKILREEVKYYLFGVNWEYTYKVTVKILKQENGLNEGKLFRERGHFFYCTLCSSLNAPKEAPPGPLKSPEGPERAPKREPPEEPQRIPKGKQSQILP